MDRSMKENTVLLFISFWFSLFFLMLALFNSFLPLEELDALNKILSTSLCIICSRELAVALANYLMKDM
jgi:hypothetical protein